MEDLARVDNQIATLYSEVTNITIEEAVALMNADGFITAEKSLEYGFFTELEDVEVVEIEVMNSIKRNNAQNRQKFQNNMSDKSKKGAWNALKSKIDDFFKDAPQNKIVFTADNSELDFYELGEDDSPAVGDKAKYDGKPAGDSNEGEYTMPSGEVYKFTSEELTEIVAKEESDDLEAENASLKEEIGNLKTEVANLKTDKATVNKKLSDATAIINGFKKLSKDDDEEEEEDKRDSKPGKDEASKSRVGNAFNKLKNKNTNGDNK